MDKGSQLRWAGEVRERGADNWNSSQAEPKCKGCCPFVSGKQALATKSSKSCGGGCSPKSLQNPLQRLAPKVKALQLSLWLRKPKEPSPVEAVPWLGPEGVRS